MTIWLISDTHFNHANILKFTDAKGQHIRPEFSNVTEMNEAMVENWNEKVKVTDHIYHLGDVALGANLNIVRRLQGHKRLLWGNHDKFKLSEYMAVGFQKFGIVRRFSDIICSHYPLHESSLSKCIGNIHGHMHQNILNDPRYENISVEHTNYTPIELDEVIERIRKRT